MLVDSEPIALRIDLQWLGSIGLELTEAEVIERFMGRSPDVMDAAVAAHLGRPVDPADRRRWTAVFREAYVRELAPVAGVLAVLDEIRGPTCVASSSGHDSLRFKLELTGLWERFAGRIFSADDVVHGKPAPDLFLFAAARMGAAPEECVVVEDSVHGVRAGRAAGMTVLAFAGGGMVPEAALAQAGGIVFTEMRELPGLIAGVG